MQYGKIIISKLFILTRIFRKN